MKPWVVISAWAACALLAVGCGSTAAERQRALRIEDDTRYAEAERAFSEHRDADAARQFTELSHEGDVEFRALAVYRLAQLRERAKDVEGALTTYQAAEALGAIERSPFAAWRAAKLLAETPGRRAEGRAALQAVVEKYPDASAADRAAKYFALRRTPDEAGDLKLDRDALVWLLAAGERYRERSVGDNLLFWAAYVQVFHLGDFGGARTTLRTLVGRYYVSPLLDDSLWLLAGIERRQGRDDAALATYEALLHVRVDQNYVLMGYRSRRLDDAAAAIGQMQYHVRQDMPAAAAAWQRLLDEFPTSVFRDDAWWGLTCAESRQGHAEAARTAAKHLLDERADSRFARQGKAFLDSDNPESVCPAPDPVAARTPLSNPWAKGEM